MEFHSVGKSPKNVDLISSNFITKIHMRPFFGWFSNPVISRAWVLMPHVPLADPWYIPYWHLFYAFFGSSSFISLLSVLDSSLALYLAFFRLLPEPGISFFAIPWKAFILSLWRFVSSHCDTKSLSVRRQGPPESQTTASNWHFLSHFKTFRIIYLVLKVCIHKCESTLVFASINVD